MINRRRSDRYAVSVPVSIKTGRGAESTLTANISAHGVAVFTDRGFSPRQYCELELKLPPDGQGVSVTAVVARVTDRLEDRAGLLHPGVAFDFYLFDARSRSAWRAFLDRLRAGAAEVGSGPATAPETPATGPSASELEDSLSTFIIKPRDVGRLWAFYRNELGVGRARIEAPVLKDVGTPVEVLVVHPATQEEWPLLGEVLHASEHGRGRGPMLEIAVADIGEEGRRAFRRYISSGRLDGIEDAYEPEVLEPDPRVLLESPTQDAKHGSSPLPRAQSEQPFDLTVEVSQPSVWSTSDGSLQAIDPLVVPPPKPAIDPLVPPPRLAQDLLIPASPYAVAGMTPPPRLPTPATVPPPIPPASISAPLVQPVISEVPALSGDPALEVLPELREASEIHYHALIADPEPDDDILEQQEDIIEDEGATSSEAVAFSGGEVSLEQSLERSLDQALGGDAARAAVLSPSGPPLSLDESASVRPFAAFFEEFSKSGRPVISPVVPEDSGEYDLEQSPSFDDVETSKELAQLVQENSDLLRSTEPRAPSLALAPAVEPRIMRAAREHSAVSPHRSVSTAGSDPALDRDIALARARVVRSPASVTACYQLGKLLLRRGGEQSLSEATSQLQRAVELEPNHPGAHLAAAELAVKQGKYDLAAEHLHKARRLGYRIDAQLERAVAEGRRAPRS
ncbi:MAG: PilZ domain-containing protein [Deltaproteobacteria bacterium]|nr:PilZ domain-containing protein [Deltaproteobacteria bacterium]